MLADVICYWKMTSFIMALNGVTPFLGLKDVTTRGPDGPEALT